MFFVKISDLFKKFPSVDRSTAAGGKYLFFLLIRIDIPALASRKRPAKCIVEIACIIQAVSVMILHHSRRTGKSSLVPADRGDHLFQKILFHFCIIVQKKDIRCSGSFDPFINCLAETIIFRQFNDMHPRIIARNERTASVRRTIIHKDHFEIFECLPFQTCKYAVQKRNSIIIRYDNRYFHIISPYSPFPGSDEGSNSIWSETDSCYSKDHLS